MKTRVAHCSRIQAAVHISSHRLQAAQLKSENLKTLETAFEKEIVIVRECHCYVVTAM